MSEGILQTLLELQQLGAVLAGTIIYISFGMELFQTLLKDMLMI